MGRDEHNETTEYGNRGTLPKGLSRSLGKHPAVGDTVGVAIDVVICTRTDVAGVSVCVPIGIGL